VTGQATREHAMSEKDWQRRVMDCAKLHGWRRLHIRAAPQRFGQSWRVPYEGDSGLPDLILARGGVVLLAELKSADGKPTPEQSAWLAAAGTNGRLWRPADWPAVLAELSATPRPETEETAP
jgi:hypothetical protein